MDQDDSVVIELHVTGRAPLTGRMHMAGRAPAPFSGWLELLVLLAEELDVPPSGSRPRT